MELGYQITGIDESAMTFDVAFSNGQWARVPLVLPFPSTREEIDALVRPYMPSEEQAVAAQASTADLSFLSSFIGQDLQTTLQKSKNDTGPTPTDPATLPLADQQKLMWGKIEKERDRRKIGGGFKVGTLWFHSGLEERTTYAHILMLAIEKSLPDDLVFKDGWKTMSGEKVPMTIGLARQIRDAGMQLDGALFDNGEAHRAAMMLAADPLAYDYSTGWPERYADA